MLTAYCVSFSMEMSASADSSSTRSTTSALASWYSALKGLLLVTVVMKGWSRASLAEGRPAGSFVRHCARKFLKSLDLGKEGRE